MAVRSWPISETAALTQAVSRSTNGDQAETRRLVRLLAESHSTPDAILAPSNRSTLAIWRAWASCPAVFRAMSGEDRTT